MGLFTELELYKNTKTTLKMVNVKCTTPANVQVKTYELTALSAI